MYVLVTSKHQHHHPYTADNPMRTAAAEMKIKGFSYSTKLLLTDTHTVVLEVVVTLKTPADLAENNEVNLSLPARL